MFAFSLSLSISFFLSHFFVKNFCEILKAQCFTEIGGKGRDCGSWCSFPAADSTCGSTAGPRQADCVPLTTVTCCFLASRGWTVGLCDFKAKTGNIGRCFVVAPGTHKTELIGLHLRQTSRITVTVSGWHNGFMDFIGPSGSLHSGCLSRWELGQSL